MKCRRLGMTCMGVIKRRSSKGLLIVFLSATLTIFACGSSDQTPADSLPGNFEAEILALMDEWHIPGMSICVIREGDIAWHRGLGVKTAQTGKPVDDATIFQAASMSKPIFAYAVLRMHDEGSLDLDTPLARYAPAEYIESAFLGHSMDTPGFNKEWFSEITARMALSHSSGLQHFGLKKPVELLFEPGSKFYYSSNGIEYLRYMVEYVKGSRIDTLIDEYVFKPLNMKHSSFSWRDQYESNSAPGHDKYSATSGFIDKYAAPTAQASLYTNAQDYGKFLLAVLEGEGLKRETYNEMVRPQIQASPDVYWGLGVGIEMAPGGKGIWHWGDGGTHTCYFYGDLDHKSGFVYFVNSYYGLAILDDIFALISAGVHPALSFTVGDWSFRDDYLSPSMEFQNKFFNGQVDKALSFYRRIADGHEKGMRFADEVSLQYWTTDLLQKNKIPDAVAMLQLLIDVYYPERADTCNALAHKYREVKTKSAAAEYLDAVNNIVEGIHFHWTDVQFAWTMDIAIADLRPVAIDEKTFLSYAGVYNPYEISYESGTLFLNATGAGKFEMIPISNNTFLLKEVRYLRIQMIKENGAVVAAKYILSDGRTQVFQKTK